MRTLVPSPRLALFIFPLLAGCTGERTAPPVAPPVEQVATLILSADGDEIARLDDPWDVAELTSKLPLAERDQLLATGSCTTDDPEFKFALRRLLTRNPGHPGPRNPSETGPWGICPARMTWGRIKFELRHW